MNNRIALVLKAKNISPSVLADDLGVQRSGISHILNGRNKPSLEFIQKLIKLYPDISIQWILFGEGPMMNPYPRQETETIPDFLPPSIIAEKPKPLIMDLFATEDESTPNIHAPERGISVQNDSQDVVNHLDTEPERDVALPVRKIEKQEIAENLPEIPVEREIRIKHSEVSSPDIVSYSDKNKKPDKPQRVVRKISKIVVFYNDRTFIEYNPGEEED